MQRSTQVPPEIAKKAEQGLQKIRESPRPHNEPDDDELWH